MDVILDLFGITGVVVGFGEGVCNVEKGIGQSDVEGETRHSEIVGDAKAGSAPTWGSLRSQARLARQKQPQLKEKKRMEIVQRAITTYRRT
jgi:hypothetical protein